MTEQEFKTLLALGHEINGVEFKGPGLRTDKAFFAKVVRAVLGMANRRDGGRVIIGVESRKLEPIGLSDEQEASWRDYDELSASVNAYASPSVNFGLEPLIYQGRNLVVIQVHEFEEVPILCSKDYGGSGKTPLILRRGACYVRSRRKPETTEIPSEEEMRELLELAIDKGVSRFVARAQKAGLFPTAQAPPASTRDEDLFQNQIEDLE